MLSLGDKLKSVLGSRLGATEEAPLVRLPKTMAALPGLKEAIETRQPVSFSYTNASEPGESGLRHGNPHAVFSQDGKTYLHMWTQAMSASGSGGLADWRTFLVGRIGDVTIHPLGLSPAGDEQVFPLAPGFNAGYYSRGRRAIAVAKY